MQSSSNRPYFEVSDIFRNNLKKVSLHSYSPDKQRVIRSILNCRTAVLGGHIETCTTCKTSKQSYNSCLNRHCPKCKGGKIFDWVSARRKELLDVPYFHLVFTIPSELRNTFYQNKRTSYDILFKAVSETLSTIGKNNFDVTLGFFAVLHTWNQELLYHPHIHVVIPSGGITTSKTWKTIGTGKFLFPVRVLSKVFRGILIRELKDAYRKSKFEFFNKESFLKNPRDFEHLLSKATANETVVYAKAPFASPEVVIKYLSSYTHRIGISNSRIQSVSENAVSFLARHKKKKHKKVLVTLTPNEFTRRFLLHVVPSTFRRIRYFGFLAGARRASALLLLESLKVTGAHTTASTPKTCTTCKNPTVIRTLLTKAHKRLPLIFDPLCSRRSQPPPRAQICY